MEAIAVTRARVSYLERVKTYLRAHPAFVPAVILFVVLAIFIAFPIGSVLIKSLFDREGGGLTLQYFIEFFSHRYHYRSVVNSLILAAATTGILMVLGFIFAYVVTRGPSILRAPLRIVALLPLIAPPYIFGISLIILAGKRGIITRALDLEEWNIYGWDGVIVSQVLSFLPLAFIMIENVLNSLDPNLEDSASDMGARESTVLRTVTMPLSTPGVLKAALLVFALSIADFANPALLGAKLSFLAPQAWLFMTGEYNFEMASVVSVLLVVPCIGIFLLHHYWLKGKAYATIVGRPVAAEAREIGPLIKVVSLVVCLLVAVSILATFAVTVFGAFTVLVGINNTFTWKYVDLTRAVELGALFTSLRVSLAAGIIGAIMGTVLAYVLMRGNVRGRNLMEFLALAGFALPGTVLGIGYVIAFNQPHLYGVLPPMTGTLAIIVVVLVFHTLAVPLEAGFSKLYQISIEMEEASADLGGRFLTTFRRVVLPLMFSAFIAGFIYTFMYSMVSVSAPILLIAPGKVLASVYIFQMANLGIMGKACGLALYLIIAVLASLAALRFITRKLGASILIGRG
ncbi:MAG: ABC transporter permease [Candidatus Methylomirabilales bacterium]